MSTDLRAARKDDVPACGRVMYEAFRDIAERHNFPPDFPSAEAAMALLAGLLEAPGFDAFVAEQDGRVIGSVFVSRRASVGGISVLTVDPSDQNRAVGRSLLERGMEFLAEHGHRRQQLVQAGYHNRSLCLYAKRGFLPSEVLANVTGRPIGVEVPGRAVRRAVEGDADACNALCRAVHGFDRPGEVAHAIARGTAAVVEHGGRITGYSTAVGFVGHGVGETNEDVKALIGSVDAFSGPGILIPIRNRELFRWCLDHGLRVVQQMLLMDTLPSEPPNGAYWPAVLC